MQLPPRVDTPPGEPRLGRENARAWFVYNEKVPSDISTHLNPEPLRAPYAHWSASVEALRILETKDGPFDGVLGFSQGAVAVHILLATQPLKTPFKFGVCMSGFPARMPLPPGRADDGLIGVPSLHLSGKIDSSVPPRYQNELAACFRAPVLMDHEKGHLAGLTPKPVLRKFVSEVVAMIPATKLVIPA